VLFVPPRNKPKGVPEKAVKAELAPLPPAKVSAVTITGSLDLDLALGRHSPASPGGNHRVVHGSTTSRSENPASSKTPWRARLLGRSGRTAPKQDIFQALGMQAKPNKSTTGHSSTSSVPSHAS
jgi:hypothetical protein